MHQVAKVLGFQPPGKSSFYFAVGFGIVGWWCLLFCVFFLLLLSFTAKHFALYGHTFISITVLSHPQACPTLCDPMDCSPPGSSVHGISRQEDWCGLSFPSPWDLPDPGIEPGSPALQADSLLSEPPGKPFSPSVGLIYPAVLTT